MMETGIRDPEAFLREAASLHAQAVYNVCLKACGGRADAEDATQEAFASLAREWRDIRDPGAVRIWLLRAALRICWRASVRARKRSRAEREVAMTRPEETQGRTGLVSWLGGAVDRLPEALRMPLVLRYYQGLGYEEIAAVLGCPVGSVSARLREGQEALRKALPVALVAVTLAGMEEALGAVPVQPVPPGLTAALGKIAATSAASAGAGISMATLGGAAMTIKKTALVTAAILLLIVGIWMALAPGRPPVQAARPGPAAAPVRLPAPEAAEDSRPSLPSPSQAPAPEGPAIAGQPAVLSGRVFDRRTNRPIRGALVAWFAQGDPPEVEGGGMQEVAALTGDKMSDDTSEDEIGESIMVGADLQTHTNAEGRYRLVLPPAWASLGYNLSVSMSGFIEVKSPACTPLGEAGERTQDIALSSGWTLRVSATCADGKPASLRGVDIFRRDMAGPEGHRGGASGAIGASMERKGMDPEQSPPALLNVTVMAHGCLAKTVSLAGIPLVDDVLTVAVQLQPFPPERQIRCRILDPEGRPLTFASLYCWPSRMSLEEAQRQRIYNYDSRALEADGSILIDLRSSEDTLFSLWFDGGNEGFLREPRIARAGSEVTLQLEAGGTISGRVLDAQGSPAPDIEVNAYFGGTEQEQKHYCWVRTDAEGRFVLHTIPTGETGTVKAHTEWPRGPVLRISKPGAPEKQGVQQWGGWTRVPEGTADLEIRLGEGKDLRPFGK